jgi:hypothetical protein
LTRRVVSGEALLPPGGEGMEMEPSAKGARGLCRKD